MSGSGKGRSPGIVRTARDFEEPGAGGAREGSTRKDAAACLRRAQAGCGPTSAELTPLQDSAGNAAVSRLLRARQVSSPPALQAKLMVGAANDPLEREADRVADDVMRTWSSAPAAPAAVSGNGDDDARLRRRAGPPHDPASAFEADTSVAPRLSARRGVGHALPAPVRHRMEVGFGADFGAVRIHRDAEAAELSTGLAAQAFTHGRDIYFGRGAYDPASRSGQHLLAHELTHVVQQRARPTPISMPAEYEEPMRPVVRRDFLPEAGMERQFSTQQLQAEVETLFYRLQKAKMLRAADGTLFESVDYALGTVFPHGAFDAEAYEAVRKQTLKARSKDRTTQVSGKRVVDPNDWKGLAPLVTEAGSVALACGRDRDMIETVLGPLDDWRAPAKTFTVISQRLFHFADDPSHFVIDYSETSDEMGAAGSTSAGSNVISLASGQLAKMKTKPGYVVAVLIHEAAHEVDSNIVDLGYRGTANFEGMLVKDKLCNAAHYEEICHQMLNQSSYALTDFKEKHGVLSGTGLRDRLMKNIGNANRGLEELWRMCLSVGDILPELSPKPKDDAKKRQERIELSKNLKAGLGLPKRNITTQVDLSLVNTVTLVLNRAMTSLAGLQKTQKPALWAKYAEYPNSESLALRAIQNAGGLHRSEVESERRHYGLILTYGLLNDNKSPYP